MLFGDAAAGSHGMPAKAAQHLGLTLGHQVERIAQMEARDRTARALEQPVGTAREDEGRPMQPVLQAAGDDADHALMEGGSNSANALGGALSSAGISRSSAA